MARYHIKKDGTPGICHAQPGKCPLGGEGQHYPSIEEAQAAADKNHMGDFTSANTAKSESNKFEVTLITRADLDKMSYEDLHGVTIIGLTSTPADAAWNSDGNQESYDFYYNENPEYKAGKIDKMEALNREFTKTAIDNHVISSGDKILTTDNTDFSYHDLNKYNKQANNSIEGGNFNNIKGLSSNVANAFNKRNNDKSKMTSFSGVFIKHKNGKISRFDDASVFMITHLTANRLWVNKSNPKHKVSKEDKEDAIDCMDSFNDCAKQ